jgi:hypothetical protein
MAVREKFTQEWKMFRGFKIIRMNQDTNKIERFIKPYDLSCYWTAVTPVFSSIEEMEHAFSLMLQDDHTITEDCKHTYFE